ncbi:MAG: hypothetical protein K8823_106 [Cenarchaeum symbiont of Oopsacas minuta]|nr:hypothetical protein [Cenarchaeum symbiont of Oopsacas minuta]
MASFFVTDWSTSPGHGENMLNSEYTEIGIGVIIDNDGQYMQRRIFADLVEERVF